VKRDDALRVLARHITDDDIVLPVYSTAFDWLDIHPSASPSACEEARPIAPCAV
jgi:hypothetical protein